MRHDDPERLLNSAAEDPELRRALGLARGIGTHPTERARLRRALGPLLAAQAGAAVLTSVSPSAAVAPGAAMAPGAAVTQGASLSPGAAVGAGLGGTKTALLWGLVTTTVVGAGIATAIVWPSEAPTPAPQVAQPVQAPDEESSSLEPSELPEVSTSQPDVAKVPESVAQASRTVAPAERVPTPRSAPGPQPVPAEPSQTAPDPLADLEAARAKLSSDPATALSLVERHRRDFPKGPLVQERELIAIEALVRTDQKAAARARADRFKQRYPSSIHLRHIEQLLDQ